MADSNVTIKMRAVDDGLITTVNNVSNQFTGLTIGTTALAVGFAGLSKATDSQAGRFLIGTQRAEKYAGAISKLANVNSKALQAFSAVSDATFIGGQLLTITKGIQDAAAVYAKIPQTLQLLQSSGVSTRSIEDFYSLTDAIKGSETSLEQFAISSVQQLGRFEQAAARAGTILRSNLRFDETGEALRANRKEQMQNAFQVQEIVNRDLQNSVSSTAALVGQYEVLSAGFTNAAESQQVLSSGLKLIGIGQAGGNVANPTATLQLLTKTLNAYELSASESAKTSAILNGIVENGLTTIQELSLGFGQTAKSAKAAGVGLEDLAGSTSVLTSQGINTANSLTGLQAVYGSIISKTPQAEKALSKLTLNGQRIRFDEAEVRAKGFTEALLDLNKAAGGNVKVLQEIFPEELAFRTILSLLAEDGKKLEETVGKIGNTTAASLDEVFNIATGDRVNRFQKIVNRFQELIIKTAQSVAPVFEPGLAVLEQIASTFANLPEPVKQAIGQFIASQISARATTSAIGILFKTLLSVAGSYLQVRLVSLALSGQLGKEAAVVRDLIAQRKGLVSAGLQLFGVDQRYRLSTELTTKAVEKQNLVTKAFTATQNKLKGIVAKNVSGFSGVEVKPENILEKGKNAAGAVVGSVKEVGRGIGEVAGIIEAPVVLGADGKPLNASGLERVKGEARKVGDAIASGFRGGKDSAVAAATEVNQAVASQILGADGKPLPVKEVTENVKKQTEKIFANVKPDKLIPKPEDALSRFTAIDSEFSKVQSRVETAVNKEIQLQKELENQVEKLSQARERATKSKIAAAEKADKAVFAAREPNIDNDTRKLLVDEAVKAQGDADRDADDVIKTQNELIEREKRLGAATSNRIDEQIKLSAAQEQATVKYSKAVKKETLARRFNRQAIILEEKAVKAKAVATETERLASLAPGEVESQAKARRARAAATSLEAKALRLKTRAETESTAALNIATAANRAAILAEQGLAETRLFGRKVLVSTTGPLGAVNKLLAAEISLKGASTVANKVFAGSLDLSLKGIKGLTSALGKGAKGGLIGLFNLTKGGVTTLIGSLGLLAPLLAAAGLAAVVFREDLFGLRKESNAVADELNNVLKKEQEIANKFGRNQRLLQFKADIKPGDETAVIEDRLTTLRLDGDLTNAQFNQLQETLVKVGDKSKLSAEALRTFEAQLEAIRQGAKGKLEKGAIDTSVDFIKGIPGKIGGRIDNTFVGTVARIRNPIKGVFNEKEAIAEIKRDREADRLIQNLSALDNSISKSSINSLNTLKITQDYSKALGTIESTNEKIRKGLRLTAEDFEQENEIFQRQKQANELLISEFEKQIKVERKLLASVNDPENKRILEDRINLLDEEVSKLEKRNEALKQSNEQFTKYYKEILPSLKRAITESANPQLALKNAQDAFSNQFNLDAQGKPTAFLKDVTTLRNEGIRFQEQVLESFQLGQFDNGTPGAAQDEVVRRLKSVRDNQIKLPDGTVGNRFNVKDRIALTKQITDIQNTGSKERIAALNLESEQVKLLQLQRVKSTEDTEKEIARLQRQTTTEAIKQKEREIKEFAKFPVRKAELERQAAQLRIKLQQQKAREEDRLLQIRRSRIQDNFNSEIKTIKSLESERLISRESAQKQIAIIQSKALREQLNNLIADYEKSGKTSVELEQKISRQRMTIRQQEAQEALRQLEVRRNRIQQQFNLEIEQIKTLQTQKVMSEETAQNRIEDIRIGAAKKQLQNLVEDFNKSGQTDINLQQKIAQQRAAIQQQKAQKTNRQRQLQRNRTQRQFNLDIEQVRTLQSERVLTAEQSNKQISQAQIAATRRQLSDLEADFNRSGKTDKDLQQKIIATRLKLRQQEAAEVERIFNLEQQRQQRIIANSAQLQSLTLKGQGQDIDARAKSLQQDSQLQQSNSQLQLSGLNAQNAAINNQLRFTGDIEQRARLETQIAVNKQRSLELQQQQELKSFETQQRINQLQLQREEIQLRISKIENERTASQLELELLKAKRENRTSEEIASIELQIKANFQQAEFLENQSIQIARTRLIQREIVENSRQELETKQRIATTNAAIDVQLARQREKQAAIQKQVENIRLASRQLQLAGNIQLRQLDAVNKSYESQKSLLTATNNLTKGKIDVIIGELNLASQLSRNGTEQRKIAQVTAAIKLRAAEQQIKMEARVLELNQAQQKAQLEQEKIRNRIAQSQNQAEIAQARADLEKAKADPTATPQQVKAAELGLQAKIEEGIGLAFSGQLLQRQGRVQEALGRTERQNLQQRSRLNFDQARVNFAQTLRGSEKRKFERKLREELQLRALGTSRDNLSNARDAVIRDTKNRFLGADSYLSPRQQLFVNQINSRLRPDELLNSKASNPNFEEFRQKQLEKLQDFNFKLNEPILKKQEELAKQGQQNIKEALEKLNKLVEEKMSEPNTVNIEVPITNSFQNADKNSGDKIVNQIRTEIYDLAKELQK